jgi:hypothetical protein
LFLVPWEVLGGGSSMALGMWSEYGHPAPSLRIKHVLFGAG